MSSYNLEDASRALGEWMLKGWVLTDESCRVADCAVPRMRSRDGSMKFCVVHDPQPGSTSTASTHQPVVSRTSSRSPATSPISRSSTPPTPLSNGPASETFTLPPPSEETIRRREQSDLAARLIGQKMLQGYAMLGEECPRVDCIGVPLIRPPMRGGGKSSNKECVICGTVYGNSSGLENSHVPSGDTTKTPRAGVPNEAMASHVISRGVPNRAPSDVKPILPVSGSSDIPKGKESISNPSHPLHAVIASIDKSLLMLSNQLNTLSNYGHAVSFSPTACGDIAKQMTVLLETRRATRFEIESKV